MRWKIFTRKHLVSFWIKLQAESCNSIANTLEHYSLDVAIVSRDVFRTLSNIHMKLFWENSQALKASGILTIIFDQMFLRYRSSCPVMFSRKGVLRNFAKFTRKHLRQSLFFNKFAGLRPANLLKKRLWHRCFPLNFPNF